MHPCGTPRTLEGLPDTSLSINTYCWLSLQTPRTPWLDRTEQLRLSCEFNSYDSKPCDDKADLDRESGNGPASVKPVMEPVIGFDPKKAEKVNNQILQTDEKLIFIIRGK